MTSLVIGLLGQILLAQYRPSTVPSLHVSSVCFAEPEKRLEQLTEDGEQIIRAILNNDKRTLLEYFSSDGVNMGADFHLSKREVEHQLKSGKGEVYATFFDTTQLRKLVAGTIVHSEETKGPVQLDNEIMSLYDYFKTANYVRVKAQQITDIPPLKDLPMWALLSFEWQGRPPRGVYYDPIFVCTDNGWKFGTFFNVP